MTLSEQIKMTPQTILVPASLKYVQGSYEHSVKEIVALIDDSNDEKSDALYKTDLIRDALVKSIALMDVVVQQGMQQKYNHDLSLKKKDYIIQNLKSFNDFQKKSVKKPTSKSKSTDGLSDAERKIIQTLKK